MLGKSIGLLVILIIVSSVTPAFALTELERASVSEPRLETSFGAAIGNDINIDQQIQISADITNHQSRSQNFVYFVQIKNDADMVVSLGWISGQLNPEQKLNPSLSWTPKIPGKFEVEIFIWGGIANHNALTESDSIQISVS